jgi:hypothetical protein
MRWKEMTCNREPHKVCSGMLGSSAHINTGSVSPWGYAAPWGYAVLASTGSCVVGLLVRDVLRLAVPDSEAAGEPV